ncbi:MAG: hypothetical protein CW716_07000 [Candidatus Bathyarchaeum sp.]|nr:MAG: hypothetical protein CW716_07000 [Candidatus Bathyarchaeum sp.]
MTTQVEFEKRKKRTVNSDVRTEKSQILLSHRLEEKQAYELTDSQAFCSLCGSYHKPSAKLRCVLNRAIRKIEVKNVPPAH